jgi:hypothetical protein
MIHLPSGNEPLIPLRERAAAPDGKPAVREKWREYMKQGRACQQDSGADSGAVILALILALGDVSGLVSGTEEGISPDGRPTIETKEIPHGQAK